jgi:DNA topoisomerase-2
VFPLKGKLLNVRDANTQQITKNEEIQNITKIMGNYNGQICDFPRGYGVRGGIGLTGG